MSELIKFRMLMFFCTLTHVWIAFRAFQNVPNEKVWILMAVGSLLGTIGFATTFHKSAQSAWESVPRKIGT